MRNGNVPSLDSWELIKTFKTKVGDKPIISEWEIYRKIYSIEWMNFKLVAKQLNHIKANFWLGYNRKTETWRKNHDYLILQDKNPCMSDAAMKALTSIIDGGDLC